jgi:hypothetical protein
MRILHPNRCLEIDGQAALGFSVEHPLTLLL